MAGRGNGRIYECVVVDLNTQRDFCNPDGVCPVANVYELIPALRHMIAWARRNCAPVVSSIESHRANDLQCDSNPLCCLDGSAGQRKIDFTLFPRRARIEVDNTLSCPIDLFRTYQQVIFRKRSNDLLANPKADRFLTQVATEQFIIFGVSLEGSVKALALGLAARNRGVTVATDACGYWSKATADLVVRQLCAKGVQITTVDQLLRHKLDRSWRYPTIRTIQHQRDDLKHYNGNARRRASPRSDPRHSRDNEFPRRSEMSGPDSNSRSSDA